MKTIRDSVGKGGKNRPEDVAAVQEALNLVRVVDGGAAPPFFTVGDFDQRTIDAILNFQRIQLPPAYQDGRIAPGGPTWQRLINLAYPETKKGHFYRSNPPVISQGDAALCWAAALQSWLIVTVRSKGEKKGVWTGAKPKRLFYDGLTWHRKILTLSQMTGMWGDLQNPDKSLTAEGIKVMTLDVGMDGDVFTPSGELTDEYLMGKLKKFGHLYMAYFSAVMYHAVVVYGVSFTDGIAVMDPAVGMGLMHRKLDFFFKPNRISRPMLVGWAV